jgi:hypothetical protein
VTEKAQRESLDTYYERQGWDYAARAAPGQAQAWLDREPYRIERDSFGRSKIVPTFTDTPVHQAFRRGVEAQMRGEPRP